MGNCSIDAVSVMFYDDLLRLNKAIYLPFKYGLPWHSTQVAGYANFKPVQGRFTRSVYKYPVCDPKNVKVQWAVYSRLR